MLLSIFLLLPSAPVPPVRTKEINAHILSIVRTEFHRNGDVRVTIAVSYQDKTRNYAISPEAKVFLGPGWSIDPVDIRRLLREGAPKHPATLTITGSTITKIRMNLETLHLPRTDR